MVVGILSNDDGALPVECFYVSLAFSFFLFFSGIRRIWVDLCFLFTLFCCGQLVSSVPSFLPNPETVYFLKSRCEEQLPHHNYILSVGGQKFYLSRFYVDRMELQPGDSLCFRSKLFPLLENANPGEFSYARYLKQQGVRARVVPVTDLERTGHSHTIYSFFNHLRENLLAKTAVLVKDSLSRRLIDALCLGYRNDLDSELQDLFVSTGTVHLLSVSGLHTGAIYLLLLFVFKQMGCRGRKSEWAVIPLLWGYACLTGLSPSVIRAATILSFITVGKMFCRTNTALNSVAAAAFFSLLIQPSAIYSLSFLMSYAAYSGIVLLYPFLFRLPGRLPPLVSKVYACCCVTIAAQLPTLPISAFYFHTININGFLANMVAVPLSTVLLYSAAVLLVLPVFVGQFLVPVVEGMSRLLVGFLHFFEPFSLNVCDVYPSPFAIFLLYFCLIFVSLFLMYPQRIWRVGAIVSLSLLLVCLITTNLVVGSRREMVVFHIRQQSVVLLNDGGCYSFLKVTVPVPTVAFPYIRQNKLEALPAHRGLLADFLFQDNFYLHEQDTILIADRVHCVYKACHILIVTDNLLPAVVFKNCSDGFPSQIVVDGSNGVFQVSKWKTFCEQSRITFFSTAECGSIKLSLK
ncbi:MAG: ComEC/Rec2 family competence protein [Odoribacter sp.]